MKDTLKSAMKEALKAKDKLRLETIRSLLSAIQYAEMQKNVESLPEAEMTAVLKSERKKLAESLEFAEKGARTELIEESTQRISVIDGFLPQQLSAGELETIISDFQQANPEANMGAIMQELKSSYAGKFDGKQASEIARRLTANQ